MKPGTNIDLHCHSSASDGLLSPRELVRRASGNGVGMLSLTDHDELGGLAEAHTAAEEFGLSLVSGVEISVTWSDVTVHVLGLGIDSSYEALGTGLADIRSGRAARARRIADALEAAGISGSLEGALGYAANPELVGRTHFARYLVEKGHASDVRSVFQRYMVSGRPGYVPHRWAALSDALTWIRASGGAAVLAHPGRYRLSGPRMRALLEEFVDLGGAGIEVVTGNHTPQQVREFARLAREYGLSCSRGSDFHGTGESRVDVGMLPPLGADMRPVWQGLREPVGHA